MFSQIRKFGSKAIAVRPTLNTLLKANFHTSTPVNNRKLGVGEALVVLQDKISKIS
jgi:hypothetical protein